MDNCDLKYKAEYKTVATTNVTLSALYSIFGINSACPCWLRDPTDTHIFPDESGAFPTLESCSFYVVEVGAAKRTLSKSDSSGESSDDFRTAYQMATSIKSKKQKKKSCKGKGPRAVPGAQPKPGHSGMESWFFKISVGEMIKQKIVPVKNILIKCYPTTTCSTVKEEIGRELNISPSLITLYDSDYLEIHESLGRVGKYWSGTRKIFVVQTDTDTTNSKVHLPPAGTDFSTVGAKINESLDIISTQLDRIERKVDKVEVFISKGSENVYENIAVFTRDILKCPICCEVTKDEIPHAVACCNSVFCQRCVNEVVSRDDSTCPLCKKRRGPMYPVLLSGMQELSNKVAIIPEETGKQDSD